MADRSDIILENLLDGVLIINASGEIIYANKASELLFGRTIVQLIGEHFGFPVTPHEVQEIQLITEGKVRIVQMLATGITWENQAACLLSLRDITLLKNVSEQLELQKEALEKANLELEQYASFASHDLKEPVRKILIYLEALLRTVETQPIDEVKLQLQRICNSAQRLNSLIHGIAEYSKYSNGEVSIEPVNLSEVLEDVKTDLELLLSDKDARVSADQLPTIDAIRIQMHQLFMNLISNSIKYARQDVSPEIAIKNKDLGSHLEVTISDNGIGFDDSYADKIFRPFNRLHSKEYEGTGIGLAICKKIVEAHNGFITVRSKPGEGSHFTFVIKKQK